MRGVGVDKMRWLFVVIEEKESASHCFNSFLGKGWVSAVFIEFFCIFSFKYQSIFYWSCHVYPPFLLLSQYMLSVYLVFLSTVDVVRFFCF